MTNLMMIIMTTQLMFIECALHAFIHLLLIITHIADAIISPLLEETEAQTGWVGNFAKVTVRLLSCDWNPGSLLGKLITLLGRFECKYVHCGVIYTSKKWEITYISNSRGISE